MEKVRVSRSSGCAVELFYNNEPMAAAIWHKLTVSVVFGCVFFFPHAFIPPTCLIGSCPFLLCLNCFLPPFCARLFNFLCVFVLRVNLWLLSDIVRLAVIYLLIWPLTSSTAG